MNISARDNTYIFFKEFALRLLTFNYFFIKQIIRKEIQSKNIKKLLDIGCGTGILAPLFPKQYYVGVDLDAKLIAFAKKSYPDYSFRVMNAASLTFPKETFDQILVVGVVHHLDPVTAQRTMAQLKKVLKKTGSILLIEAIPPIRSYNVIGKVLRLLDEGHHIRSIRGYRNLFSRYFRITKSYLKPAGVFDYGVFVLQKKTTK